MLKSAWNLFGVNDEGTSEDFGPGSVLLIDSLELRVLNKIDEGGSGAIYTVVESSTKKIYALKRMLSTEPSKTAAILHEISLNKKLSFSPQIVTFYGAVSKKFSSGISEYCMLMEYCSGGSLSKFLASQKTSLSPSFILLLFEQIVSCVSVLHTHSLIHRDIKCENFLISSEKILKLCDFGSVTSEKILPESHWPAKKRAQIEEELAVVTTPMYRSPETLDTWNNFPIQESVDIWALGCILYSLIFKVHPFGDSSKLKILNGDYSLTNYPSNLSVFINLIQEMLQVNPLSRPSISYIHKELRHIAQTLGVFHSLGEPLEPSYFSDFEVETSILVEELTSSHPTFSSLLSSSKNLMKNIRESGKNMLDSLSFMSRSLDFDCITERIAVMSFPTESSLELSSNSRNYLEDVKNLMESKYPHHYSIFNVSHPRRSYSSSKFPTGFVKESSLLSLTDVMNSANDVIQYLTEDSESVVVIHDWNGDSDSALLTIFVLLQSGLFDSLNSATQFFTLKRRKPNLSNRQKKLLEYFEVLIQSSSSRNVDVIHLSNLILEPLPLFTKGKDGVRPYVEVFSNSKSVTLKSQDSLLFTSNNHDHVNVSLGSESLLGDVFLHVYHSRSSLGKMNVKSVPICSLYFHTGFLSSSSSSLIFPLRDLDDTTSSALGVYPQDFRVILNFKRSSKRKKGRLPTFNSSSSPPLHSLLFFSPDSFEETRTFIQKHLNISFSKTETKVEDDVEVEIEVPHRLSTPTPSSPPKDNNNVLLLDIFGNESSKPSQLSTSQSLHELKDSSPDLLLDLGAPLPYSASSSSLDPFGIFLESSLKEETNTTNNKDNYSNGANIKTWSDLDDIESLLQNVDVSSQSKIHEPPQKVQGNYFSNSSSFHSTKDSVFSSALNEDTFSDLLNGFHTGSSKSTKPTTIGAMRKKKELSEMSEDEAKVSEWIEGKERNIRVLLCSLHSVIWPNCKWIQCYMHQLVSKGDVKKYYRKACLSIHPDKHSGSPHLQLSQLIFMELNDAMTEFEKSVL